MVVDGVFLYHYARRVKVLLMNEVIEVPALRQRGTIRLTAAERSENWRNRCAAARLERMSATAIEYEIQHPARKRVAPSARKLPLVPKQDRDIRRASTLRTRFAILPRFIESSLNNRYQLLRARALRLFDSREGSISAKLSKILSRMSLLRSLAARATAIHRRRGVIVDSPVATAWIINMKTSEAEFREALVQSAFQSAVCFWMLPRTGVAVSARVGAQMKCFLDEALRKENALRKESKNPPIKNRDDFIVATKRGSYWRQVVRQVVSDAVELCETYLIGYRYRGAYTVARYKKAFGLTCKDSDLVGVGPRQFAAAEALLSLQGGVDQQILVA